MPSRNIVKDYAPESFYHVYARGVDKQKIFRDASDYRYFNALFIRYLSKDQMRSKDGTAYPHFKDRVQLLAYCLMTNHFHLLIFQNDIDDLQSFMRSLMTSYSRYFNLKYGRTGSLFESRYKASRIDSDQYLQHISRYIHLNPRYWQNYYNSSLKFYRDGNEPYWLKSSAILEIFSTRQDYMDFVSDYAEMKDMISEMKYQLADL
jgi:REP element-mobilizing transposase RayT